MTDSTAQHVITTNTKDGKSIFYEPAEKPKVETTPYGSNLYVYASPELHTDMSYNSTADLDTTATVTQTGMSGLKGRITVDNGFATSIVAMNPGTISPMHRTRTVDIGIVIEGEGELHLDDGSFRTLKAGDTFIDRGTMHKWKNTSDKVFKIHVTALDAKPIKDANGDELEEEWRFEH